MRRFMPESGGRERRPAVRRRRRAVREGADVVPRRAAGAVPRPQPAPSAARRRRQRAARRGADGAASLPAGFDAAGFERIAKMIFIRLQAANDAGDLNDLRAFTTPEMFAAVKLDLQERGADGAAHRRRPRRRRGARRRQRSRSPDRQRPLPRPDPRSRRTASPSPFDEVWHLVKPADGSREWAIAGIQQTNSALAQAA